MKAEEMTEETESANPIELESNAIAFLTYLDDLLELPSAFKNAQEKTHVLRLRNTVKNGLQFSFLKPALHEYAKNRYGKDWIRYVSKGGSQPPEGLSHGRDFSFKKP